MTPVSLRTYELKQLSLVVIGDFEFNSDKLLILLAMYLFS